MENRIFSYEEASELLDAVRQFTSEAHNRLQELRAQIDALPGGSKRARKLSEWINTVIHQWSEEMMAMGALPKGLWTVDFDSGKGFYYCWTLNEATLAYFHKYEEGFIARKHLSEIESGPPPQLIN